jgi:hypothetical protein
MDELEELESELELLELDTDEELEELDIDDELEELDTDELLLEEVATAVTFAPPAVWACNTTPSFLAKK